MSVSSVQLKFGWWFREASLRVDSQLNSFHCSYEGNTSSGKGHRPSLGNYPCQPGCFPFLGFFSVSCIFFVSDRTHALWNVQTQLRSNLFWKSYSLGVSSWRTQNRCQSGWNRIFICSTIAVLKLHWTVYNIEWVVASFLAHQYAFIFN